MIRLRRQLANFTHLSSQDILYFMTHKHPYAVITVGTYQEGEKTVCVYGEDLKHLPIAEHIYEIGSITKIFTGALIAKAILEQKITLDSPIGSLLGNGLENTPTFRQLVTHTAGLKSWAVNWQMARNAFTGRNPGYGISIDILTQQLAKALPEAGTHPVKYSNYGLALAGNAVAAAYNISYHQLVTDYLQNDLNLPNTQISDARGDFGNYWRWNENDGYLPAGGLTSVISDMMRYLEMNLNEEYPELALAHQSLTAVNYSSPLYRRLNSGVDAVGITWLHDYKNNTLWHNGGTDNYNADIRLNKETQTGIVVLANQNYLKPMPTTVLGLKLMEEMSS